MDHVVGSGQQTDGRVDRQHDPVVGRHQARTIGIGAEALAGFDLILLAQHVRHKAEPAMIGIFVGPEPLVADRLQRHGVFWRGFELIGEQREAGERDPGEDQHGDQRPRDLEASVVAGLRRHRIGGAAIPDDHPDQQAEHEQRDDRDDRHQDRIVEHACLATGGRHLVLDRDALGNRQADARDRCGDGRPVGVAERIGDRRCRGGRTARRRRGRTRCDRWRGVGRAGRFRHGRGRLRRSGSRSGGQRQPCRE